MQKFISLIKLRDAGSDPVSRRSLHQEFLARYSTDWPGLRRLKINVIDLVPRWPHQLSSPQDSIRPPVDIVLEAWFNDDADAGEFLKQQGNAPTHRVTESIEKDVPRVPGAPHRVKLFSFITPNPGLSDADFRRHWNEHVPIALRVHRACCQYVRHFVEETHSPGTLPVRGIGMIAMHNLADLESKLFDSAEGMAEVAADTAEFVGNRMVVVATEHDSFPDLN